MEEEVNAKEVIKQGLIDTGLVKKGSDWDQVFDGEIGYAAQGIIEALDKAYPGWQNVTLYREQAREAVGMYQEIRMDLSDVQSSYDELVGSITWTRPEGLD